MSAVRGFRLGRGLCCRLSWGLGCSGDAGILGAPLDLLAKVLDALCAGAVDRGFDPGEYRPFDRRAQ